MQATAIVENNGVGTGTNKGSKELLAEADEEEANAMNPFVCRQSTAASAAGTLAMEMQGIIYEVS